MENWFILGRLSRKSYYFISIPRCRFSLEKAGLLQPPAAPNRTINLLEALRNNSVNDFPARCSLVRALRYLCFSLACLRYSKPCAGPMRLVKHAMSGYYLCGGQTSCFGYVIQNTSGFGTPYQPQSGTCSCVYRLGCSGFARVHQFVETDYAKLYGTRPMMFLGCNGSLLMALPRRRQDPASSQEGY